MIDNLVNLRTDKAKRSDWHLSLPELDGAFPFTTPKSGSSDALESYHKLIQLGPVAMPYLLAALNDNRRTQLTACDGGGVEFMSLGMDAAIPRTVGNAREEKVFRDTHTATVAPNNTDGFLDEGSNGHNPNYRIRVGDVCYQAIGVITNRYYVIARFVPSDIMHVFSPVQNPFIASFLRALWDIPSLPESLRQSLLIDLKAGKTDNVRRGAKARLSYYFPEVSQK